MAVTFITYLWHYLVARLVYDQFLRPLTHGDPSRVLLLSFVVAAAVMVWRRRRRYSPRTGARPRQ